MGFNNYLPTRVISGKDCVLKYNFTKFGSHAFIVCGKTGAVKSGLLKDLEKTLKSQKIDYYIYDEIEPNPTAVSAHLAGAMAREFSADFIIGAGGGSAMDAAKAAAVFAENEKLTPPQIFTTKITDALPIITIGTTAGTGSEVTPYSILTYVATDECLHKKSVKSPLLYAKICLCDAKYTMSLDWETTVNTALDTLCHAIEGIYSKRCNDMSRMYSLETVRVCWSMLKKAYWKGVVEKGEISFEIREKLLFASIIGGYVINITGTSYPHTMGYNLTTKKGIPHGKACAVFLSDFVRRMSPFDKESTALLEEAIGEDTLSEFLDAIDNLIGNILVLSDEEARSLAEELADSKALTSAISDITIDDVYLIYRKCFCQIK
ncbi:MAG: iron-containing alcohol dehydrogenase [Clostridia bacterium]